MRFCPKCGTRLRMKSNGEDMKLVCEKCGYSTAEEKGRGGRAKSGKADVSIKVLEGDEIEPLPTTRAECPKCGHDTAVWWMLQTRGGDEPTTQFYRCVKCNHTWRHYA